MKTNFQRHVYIIYLHTYIQYIRLKYCIREKKKFSCSEFFFPYPQQNTIIKFRRTKSQRKFNIIFQFPLTSCGRSSSDGFIFTLLWLCENIFFYFIPQYIFFTFDLRVLFLWGFYLKRYAMFTRCGSFFRINSKFIYTFNM